MDDVIYRQAAIEVIFNEPLYESGMKERTAIAVVLAIYEKIKSLPSSKPEDYTKLKREFLRMASYIDVLLECSDEQKETLIGFISRLAEFMPWTERD